MLFHLGFEDSFGNIKTFYFQHHKDVAIKFLGHGKVPFYLNISKIGLLTVKLNQ